MTKSTPTIDQLFEQIQRAAESEENQRRRQAPAPRVSTYLENLGWIDWLGYDIDAFHTDPRVQTEIALRQKLLQFETFLDDTVLSPDMGATTGMYWEFTLLDMPVRYEPSGVPQLRADHPLSQSADLSLLRRHDFHTGGDMPHLLRLHDAMVRLAAGRWSVGFPRWERGPLDMAIQLRGYEGFIADVMERPRFAHDLMTWLVEERIRWWEAYCQHFGVEERAAGIGDDWVNVPFISPAIFRDFVLPYYLELEKYHGRITYTHTCGNTAPIQQYLLQMGSLKAFEVNPWTDLQASVRNLPADKHLGIVIKNVDVLLEDEKAVERRIRRVVELCMGRSYSLCGGALVRIHASWSEEIGRIRRWIGVVRETVGRQ